MEFIPSPNYTSGRGGNAISLIIIHWFGVGTINGAIESFKNPARQASAHYLISDDRLVQMVNEEDTAWHSGVYLINEKSIGIEHDANPDKMLSEASYQTSARLVREICARYNIPLDREHIKGHNEIKPTQCPGTIDINKIIEIAKGDEEMTDQQKQDVARALVRSRCGKIVQSEVDHILANYGPGKTSYEDYAANNIIGDNHIPMLWKATLGRDQICPQDEIDHYKVAFNNGDLELMDLAGNWHDDHVIPAIKSAVDSAVDPLNKEIETLKNAPKDDTPVEPTVEPTDDTTPGVNELEICKATIVKLQKQSIIQFIINKFKKSV